jgi:hypothetical protein
MKLYSVGCSFTEGQGLENYQIENYTKLLSEKHKINCHNFGNCGASNDYIFRKVFDILNEEFNKEDVLIIQWTNYIRMELPRTYDSREWYFTIPNTLHPSSDKVLKDVSFNGITSKYVMNQNIEYKKTDEMRKKLLELHDNDFKKFIGYFLNTKYQINKTKNYIKALYAYLELNGYKHLHFFGWDNCIIPDNEILNYPNFLKETFGGYTNTIGNDHPNKEGHEIWANLLSNKLEEFKYIEKNLI